MCAFMDQYSRDVSNKLIFTEGERVSVSKFIGNIIVREELKKEIDDPPFPPRIIQFIHSHHNAICSIHNSSGQNNISTVIF